MNKRIFEWDGEKIKETQVVEDMKHTPKDILNGLDNVRAQINQFENAAKQLEQQIESNKKNLESAKAFEKDLSEFEDKCVEIQKNKLKLYITQMHDEAFLKAKENADKVIAKAPDAYDERQAKMVPYLEYQKILATNEKVTENIAGRIIKQYLYEEPIFENPFA